MRPKKIMIVEDDAVTAMNISKSMIDLDYEVSSIVDSGEKVLEKVEETRPDLVLMDIILSGKMDGIKAAEIIRAKHNIPVIYLTAHSDKKTQKRAKASSPFGYILKPFKPKELEVTIAMALHRHSVEKRMEHVYSVLEAMKKINQIGSRTRKPENFIKQVCEKLVTCTEYKKAWIILFDKDQKVTAFADAGYEEGIIQMIREMEKGQFPECVTMALKKSTFIIESDKSSGCVSCKLWNTFEDKKALKSRLKYGNILYGVLSITVEKDFLLEKKVLSVFNEMVGDIVDVLNRMRIEDQLRTSEVRSRTIIENNVDGIVIIDDQGFIRFCNPAFGKLINKKEKELLGRHFGSPLVSEEATEIDIVGNNLTSIVAEMRTCLIEWEGKPAYLASIRDITERILAAEKLEQSLERLDKVLVNTIHAMSMIVELRDPYTAGHQRRVANLASAIGKEIGLDKDQIIGLKLAGEIHDIGKIHIPAEILAKPFRLNENEFMLIKKHCQIGYDILKEIDFPWPIADIIYQHHEKMNGSGYPKGLMGNDILLLSRIIAVADVIEAMSSHRPYRPALGMEKALEEIKCNRDILYDPDVVDACVKLITEDEFDLDKGLK